MAITGIINVNPQDLIDTADSFSGTGSELSSCTSEMMSLVTGLTSVWSGDAADSYISKFAALDDDIEKLLAMVNEHVIDLQEMAADYMNRESFNNDCISTLSTDVIV